MFIDYFINKNTVDLVYTKNNVLYNETVDINYDDLAYNYTTAAKATDLKSITKKKIRKNATSYIDEFRLCEIISKKGYLFDKLTLNDYLIFDIQQNNIQNTITVNCLVKNKFVLRLTTDKNAKPLNINGYKTITKLFNNAIQIFTFIEQKVIFNFRYCIASNEFTKNILLKTYPNENLFILDYDKLYTYIHTTTLSYNSPIADILRVELNNSVINIVNEQLVYTKMPYNKLFNPIKTTEFIFYNEIIKNELKVETNINIKSESKSSKGGHIYLKGKGLYSNVLYLDFKSWYPSIIRTFNIPMVKTVDTNCVFNSDLKISLYYNQAPTISSYVFDNIQKKRNDTENNIGNITYKLLQNRAYGCFANKTFRFFDYDISNTITGFGRLLLKKLTKFINNHFKQDYDTYLMFFEKLGYDIVQPINDDVVIYNQTDSLMLNYGMFGDIESKDIIKAYDSITKNTITTFLDTLVKQFVPTPSRLILEVEAMYENVLFLAKNQYIATNNGDFLVKGGGLVNKNTPTYTRKILEDTYTNILTQKLTRSQISNKVKTLYKLYKLQRITTISMSETIDLNYKRFVINDRDKVIFANKPSKEVKGCVLYNFLVQKKQLTGKMPLFSDGEYDIRHYPIMGKDLDFCYPNSIIPYEVMLEPDFRKMFNMQFLTPLNKVLKILNISPLNDLFI